MCQPSRWWIGLLPLLALWLTLDRMETDRIEADLSGRADAALAQVVGEPGFSIVAGRDVSLNGWIFDDATRQAALAAVAITPGIRLVLDGLSAPLLQNPYIWRASRNGGVVILSGAAPSPTERAAIVAAAQEAMPRARIVDQMSYFSGAPENFVARTQGALEVLAHLANGAAQLRGGELSLSGQALSGAEYQAAVAAVRRQPEGVTLVKAELSPPNGAAFPFVAESDGKSLTLSGLIGSEAERATLLAEAQKLFPDSAPIDQLQVASGAPARFAVDAGYALRALAQLKSGKVVLIDNVATLSGQARAGMDALAVAEAVSAAPAAAGQAAVQGVTLDVRAVAPGEAPLDVLTAEKTEKAVVLSGFYGDDETHQKILAAAREKFAGLAVTDEMRRGAAARKSLLPAALGGLDQLARLQVGKFCLRDHAASLSGDAGRAEIADEVKAGFIGAMPDGFSVETRVSGAAREAPPPAPAASVAPLDPPGCRKRLTDLVHATPIRFDYRRAELKPESSAVIAALAAVARRCPAVSFEVVGQSEDFIHLHFNRNLSRRRAEAVAAALAAAGVDARRLTAASLENAAGGRDAERANHDGVEFNLK